jgi:hypothetical protein
LGIGIVVGERASHSGMEGRDGRARGSAMHFRS